MNPWFGAPFGKPLLDAVEAAYATPPRVYHVFDHAIDVLATCGDLSKHVGFARPREVAFAALVHDAVYVAGAKDNEEKSADLARDLAKAHADPVDADEVARLVLLTARHGKLDDEALDSDAALFLDADMSILGSTPARFDAYDRAIAAEYEFLPPEIYAVGRRAFLEGVLASKRIFHSPFLRSRLEEKARANVRRAIFG